MAVADHRGVSGRDLEPLLAARKALEDPQHKGPRARGHGDFPQHHRTTVAWLIRTALRGVGVYGRGLRNALRPEIRRLDFQIPRLPAAFDGFRVLQLADLHIDCRVGLAEAVADVLSGVSADLCVLTGDYRFEVDGPCEAVYAGMKTVLSAIGVRHGIYGILGNHDTCEIAPELENQGVRMLVNEAAEVALGDDSIWLMGVDDPHFYGVDDLPAAIAPVPRGACKVLLAHSPEIYEEAAAAGVDLYLCGHTHAGQIRLPGIGAVLKQARCPRPYATGAWEHGRMQGYTSAGIGCSLVPVRYNCPPEITVITLSRSGQA